jgi:putative acetyltransferase
MWDVRDETPDDAEGIRAVHTSAFAPSAVEAQLVDDLRTQDALVRDLCLVATEDDIVIGHIAFSRATLDSGHEILVLAPMAVLPEHQRKGVGCQLIGQSMRRAALTDFPLVSVVGHADYFPQFGFEQAAPLGIEAPFDVPQEAWMARRLARYTDEARGKVTYAEAFAGTV